MVTALAAMLIAVLMSFLYSGFDAGITALGEWTAENAVLGGFVFASPTGCCCLWDCTIS